MRHVWAGHSQLERGLGGQLPRRVSGGICGVAAGHAKSEGQTDAVEVKGFKGERKKRNSSGEESGEKENARKRELGPPLRDVIAFFWVFYIFLYMGYILYLTAISPWKEK